MKPRIKTWTIHWDPPAGTARIEGPHTDGYLEVVPRAEYDDLARRTGEWPRWHCGEHDWKRKKGGRMECRNCGREATL